MAIKYDSEEQKILHGFMVRDAGYIKRTIEDILRSTKSYDLIEKHTSYTVGAMIIHLTSHVLSDVIHAISDARKGEMEWEKARKVIIIHLVELLNGIELKTSEVISDELCELVH